MLQVTQCQQSAEKSAKNFTKKNKKDAFVIWSEESYFFTVVTDETEKELEKDLEADEVIVFKSYANGKTWVDENFKR